MSPNMQTVYQLVNFTHTSIHILMQMKRKIMLVKQEVHLVIFLFLISARRQRPQIIFKQILPGFFPEVCSEFCTYKSCNCVWFFMHKFQDCFICSCLRSSRMQCSAEDLAHHLVAEFRKQWFPSELLQNPDNLNSALQEVRMVMHKHTFVQ